MCSPFSCGSFKSQEQDDFDELLSPCTTPNRSKSSRNHSNRRESKNPYANQGLDKFHALLAEFEDKKKKIYTQKGSEDISFIYFTNSNSGNWEPIIVRVKKKETDANNTKAKQMEKSSETQAKHTIEASRAVVEVRQPKEELIQRPNTKVKNWRHIFGLLPVTIVLILLFLAMYGRSFAILCTTLGWYSVPMMKNKSSSSDRPKKNNEHV